MSIKKQVPNTATATSNRPCSAKAWCHGMKMVLDGDMASKRAGFQMAHMFSPTGVRSMLVYRPHSKSSPPIILNVCPWCRVELEPICSPASKKRAKKAKTSVS